MSNQRQQITALLDKITERASAPPLPSPAARRALRIAAGATLAEFGDAVGVTGECIRLWEAGRRRTSAPFLVAYAELLERVRGALQ